LDQLATPSSYCGVEKRGIDLLEKLEKKHMNIGWIGLGNMGLPMARNAIKAGHKLTVYNRTRDRAQELERAGAKVAGTPAEAASNEVVVTMLSDDHAVEDVIFGSGKVLAALPKGGIHVCTSTISVELAKRLSEAHQERGQAYISSPVFGRPEAAESGKLVAIPAGPHDAVQRLQPLFDAISSVSYFLGENAMAANVAKLSGNFLIASAIESLGEAFALVRKYGVDPKTYLEVITGSLFNAPAYKVYGGIIAEGKYEPVGFRMALGLKDVRLVLAAADTASVPMPVASMVRDRFLSGVARGMQDADWSSIARLVAENAGLS
jgi:3-hydroxyisobutyrate dehydrogenase-like beta-hydroxyacid dehydrogenase